MTDVGKICEDQIRNEEKYDRWERLLKKDGDGFLQVVVQKYVQNRLPEEKVDEVFHTLQDVMKEGDRFITVYADLDLAYKITNELEYEASRFSMVRMIEEKIAERFTYWKFESERTAWLLQQYPNHIKGSAESEEVSKKRRDCSLLQMHPEREYLQSRRLLKKKRKAHIRRRQR